MRPGEIWLTALEFSDGSGAKVRPVLILLVDGLDGVVAAVTTGPPRTATDLRIQLWVEAGLRRPSTVRLLRLATLTRNRLIRRLGQLEPTDARRLSEAWKAITLKIEE